MKKIISTLHLLLLLTSASMAQNVGIGTNTPSANLHIQQSLKAVLKIGSTNFADSSHLIFSNRLGTFGTDMVLAFNGEKGLSFSSQSDILENTVNDILFVRSIGNVGIRNATPLFPLDVNGTFNLSGSLRVSGSTGSPGDVLSIKPNGALVWQPGTQTITDTLTIQPYGFYNEFSSFPWVINQTTYLGYGPNTGTGVILYYAAIEFPVSNAAIKEIRGYLYDASGSNDIYINVYEAPITSNAISTRVQVAQLLSAGSSATMQQPVWTPAVPYPIANGSKTYFLRARTLSGTWPGDNSIGFRALRIIYTYTR